MTSADRFPTPGIPQHITYSGPFSYWEEHDSMNTTTTESQAPEPYDVAILGAGMAGGMLGAALARNGVKVLLIDAGVHPASRWGSRRFPTPRR